MSERNGDTWEYWTMTSRSIGREGAEWRHSHYEYIDLDELDKAGGEGWEAVSVQWDGVKVLAVFFKRKIPLIALGGDRG